jgi:hypothetical protein
MRSASIAVVIGFALAAGAAIAQDQPKEAAPGEAQPPAGARFSFVPADGGYLRLDSMSGQVSFCGQRTAGWACQLVPDDRAALDAEIGRLQAEVGRLKAGVAQAEPPRPQAELSPRTGKDESHLRFPTREEMERARAAVERTWRHLVDMIYDFQKDVMKKD